MELVVHARTQAHGYRPPAYWERIGDIRAKVRLPVVANGEIWTVADARRCRELSGCDRLMLGRGMVADPGLALAVLRDRSAAGVLEAAFTELPPSGLSWTQVLGLLEDFWHRTTHSHEPRHRAGRLKQWLQLLRLRHPEAAQAYQQLRTVHDSRAIALGLFCREPTALE